MSAGLVLAGRYRLISELGQGGMGSVWRAEDMTLGAEVAVKLIDAALADSTDAVKRFRREAQAAATAAPSLAPSAGGIHEPAPIITQKADAGVITEKTKESMIEAPQPAPATKRRAAPAAAAVPTAPAPAKDLPSATNGKKPTAAPKKHDDNAAGI
jgi:hypothetical protein